MIKFCCLLYLLWFLSEPIFADDCESVPNDVKVVKIYQIDMICQGVLLTSNWLLTSAHCTVGRNPDYLTTDIKSRIIDLKIHPSYQSGSMSYNLALIKLDPGFELKSNISLPEMGQKFTDYVTFIGYGATSNRVNQLTINQKHEYNLGIMSVTHCNYNYGLQTPPQDIVCAGAPKVGYGVCAGDTGGPLIQFDSERQNHVLVGVAIYGIECGRGKYPSVFAQVSSNVDWIRSVIHN